MMKPYQCFDLLKTLSLREETLKKQVSQDLLRSCKRARKRCGAFLEQQRKVEEQMKVARAKEELAKQTRDALQELENEIQFLKKRIEVAETSAEEDNHESGKTLN